MYDSTKTRMLLMTAVFAAVAAVFAGGANALDDGGSGSVADTGPQAQTTVDPLAVSHLLGRGLSANEAKSWTVGACSHEVKAASCYAMFEPTGDSALTRVAKTTAMPWTIPDLSHGVGVEVSQFSGQPSLGLTGDSALTRVDRPVAATGAASSSGNDTDWTWIGFGAGMAALLAAALAGLYVTARHRSRAALP